ncbi:MAG: dephospho-CoA kinase [Hydrocarboniphaga sp.]|uniref:dephospho-CoA kinase n=1 Tax=Hydrocarboniphaga sp. TaxID=2033016 RepID=UPI0026076B00|nr:dephospho-CoA kinase [Hydrocarboniphaga sp.]MDB5971933.1 dephospho-CoA kinase [Hydrocarboniphaga sp.]
MSRLTIGLTGGIASGKTLVADAFIALGVPVLDADQVARDVVAPGEPALTLIAEAFGAKALQADGTLDRRRMRELVFGNPAELRRLEAITHPAIRQRMRDWRDAQTAPYCMLSVAILVESAGMRELVDRVLVIDVPVETQMARLTARDQVDATLARQMIAAQASREQRLAAADDIIANDGSVAQTLAAVQALHQRYLHP